LVKFIAGLALWLGAPVLVRISGRFR
jgi:hypothetical protein